MRSSGGTALTLEMGQIGFDRYQRDVGVLTLIRALNCVQQLTFGGASLVLNRSNFSNEIYTFADTIQADDSLAKLDDGWYNFREFLAGERLGTQSTGEIKAAQDGWMLFPKYSFNESARALSTSKVTKVELGRILRRASPEELPQDIC